MALREIRLKGDEILQKKCRLVTEFNPRLHTLLDDMKDTLIKSEGVGLAAPQVGILRRVIVVLETNVKNPGEEYIIELVNPEIIRKSGEQTGVEGCLSVPGKYGIVSRPEWVMVRAQDRYGNEFTVEGEGLTARCFCHEIDHLDGKLFTERAQQIMSAEDFSE